MDNIMNPPIELEWGPAEIVLAYNDSKNTKRVAKTFCITDKEVKDILKKAEENSAKTNVDGVIKNSNNVTTKIEGPEKTVSDAEQALNEIGMSQKDFYKS